MSTKKLVLYTAVIIGLLLLASILTGCASCDWKASNYPIQNIEKEVLKFGFLLPIDFGRFSRRKIAMWIVIA